MSNVIDFRLPANVEATRCPCCFAKDVAPIVCNQHSALLWRYSDDKWMFVLALLREHGVDCREWGLSEAEAVDSIEDGLEREYLMYERRMRRDGDMTAIDAMKKTAANLRRLRTNMDVQHKMLMRLIERTLPERA